MACQQPYPYRNLEAELFSKYTNSHSTNNLVSRNNNSSICGSKNHHFIEGI